MNDHDSQVIEASDDYVEFDDCPTHGGIECEGDCPCLCDECGVVEVFGSGEDCE